MAPGLEGVDHFQTGEWITFGAAGSAQLKSSAPGLVVVVCATIVMWLSLEVHFTVTSEPAKGPAAMNAGGGSGAPDPAKDGVSMP